MFEPELIYHDGDYGIFFQKGIFCNGFNVYKKDSTHWNKLHDELSCFLNIDGAKKFLEKIKAEDLRGQSMKRILMALLWTFIPVLIVFIVICLALIMIYFASAWGVLILFLLAIFISAYISEPWE